MESITDKLGELLISYDNVLDEFNTLKMCNYILEKETKILDMVEIMTTKYKDKLLNQIEKIISDYSDILSDQNLKIFINMIINSNNIKGIYK